MLKKTLENLFKYNEKNNYEFILPNSSNNIDFNTDSEEVFVSSNIYENINYLKIKYNMLINSDIKIREFTLKINNISYSSFLLYIDGMVDDNNINDFILQPLFLKSSIQMKTKSKTANQIINSPEIKLEDFLYSSLIPQCTVSKESKFSNIISKANSGFCCLFVNSMNLGLCIETKGFKYRAIDEPSTESIVKGSHAGFVENLRINTSLIRRIVNNENLIIEECSVGKFSNTKVAICYIKNITNDDLVAETKYRINNLKIDYLLSSGQLEQFIIDNYKTAFPQVVSTERPDKTSNFLFLGRVAILVDGSPFAIILPAILIDFLTSPEDFNLNYIYANFLRALRFLALICAILIPGLYIATTMYHYELIPSELLFAIISARKAIPFPIIFEIIIMEICFELIQEAGIRAPDSFTTAIGIIGALILGDAAVSANIVSPILIIIVAFSGICAFVIPDNSLRSSIRMFRFIYIIFGYIAGFLGIATCFFIHFLVLSNLTSFGIPFFSPYIPTSNLSNNETLFISPVWKREKRSHFLNTKKPNIEDKKSMKWRNNE